jgi:Family of unknown function (DUF6271)
MTRILYVPTNRRCLAAIENGMTECAVMAKATGEEYVFVLVEHADAPHVPEHAASLAKEAAASGIPALHLTVAAWKEVLEQILCAARLDKGDCDRARELLTRQGVAYASGPNKAFLTAAALGVDTLHRRDSDHLPDTENGRARFPGAMEVQAIGRRVREVTSLRAAESLTPQELGQEILFVGSGMFGDPAHDRRELITAGEEFGVRVLSLSSPWLSQESLLRDVRGYFTSEASVRYDDDFFQIDDSGRTELGVSCLRRVFLHLPEMPIPDTLGCDYFQKNLLYQLSRPVMFQSRKMRHDHDTQRKQSTTAQFVDYSLRDLRYVVLWPIWSRHNENLRNAPPTFVRSDGSIDAAWYAGSFRRALAEKGPEAKGSAQRFAEVFRDASRKVTGVSALRLRAVADAADNLGDNVVNQVSAGIEEYCWLIERWQNLIDAARSVSEAMTSHTIGPAHASAHDR